MNTLQKVLLTLTIVFSGFAAKDSLLAQQSNKGTDNNRRDTMEGTLKTSTTTESENDQRPKIVGGPLPEPLDLNSLVPLEDQSFFLDIPPNQMLLDHRIGLPLEKNYGEIHLSDELKMLALLRERDQRISEIEKDSLDRQEVLETRKKDHDKEMDKQFGALVGMVNAGDAVNIDPERREEIYNKERAKQKEREYTAAKTLVNGMCDLTVVTADAKMKANLKFLKELSESCNLSLNSNYNLQFLALLRERDQRISEIEKDSLDRQEVLETRKKDHDKEMDKQFGALVGMVNAGDAVNIDPERREEIYNKERAKQKEREYTAAKTLVNGMCDLTVVTADAKMKANLKFLKELVKLNLQLEAKTTLRGQLPKPTR